MHVQLSGDELTALSNCINETIEAVDDFELQTRTGWGRSDLLQLRGRLLSAARVEN